MSDIDSEVLRLIDNGALGRSRIYRQLLRYLAEASGKGELPKEIDIASDVLGRKNFDPASDSTVRVYVHNLRQKLDTYYAGPGRDSTSRLVIPKGKYQLAFESHQPVAEAPASRATSFGWPQALGLAIVAALAFMLGRVTDPTAANNRLDLRSAPVWQAFFDDEQPVLVVVGDYYIFAETPDGMPGDRLIRDFFINNPDDLDAWIEAEPSRRGQYADLRLSYLPLGTASALKDVLGVLNAPERRIRVIPASQFRAPMLRASHVVYVGYLSGLGNLDRYAFGTSRLELGTSYDELIDSETREVYVSGAGFVTDDDSGYSDYGFVSTFPGPAGNQFLFVTGLRDEGLMRMAATLADPDADLHTVAEGPAFETLYQVSGVDRADVAATRRFWSPLDASRIWVD